MNIRKIQIVVLACGTLLTHGTPVIAANDTTSYEFQGYEFQIPNEWEVTEEIDGISCTIEDGENTIAVISFDTQNYVGDDFLEQYKYVDDTLNRLGEDDDTFEREEIMKFSAGDYIYLIGDFSRDGRHYVIGFLPDKTSNSIITIMLQELSDVESQESDFYGLLSSIEAVEDKITQKEVWDTAQKAEEKAEKESEASMTMSQSNAVQKAKSYLSHSAFSRQGLIDQLSSKYGSGFALEDAEFAVAYLEDNDLVDWFDQAVKQAESYLSHSSFSKTGLIEQLSSEYGSVFTLDEAIAAVNYLEENDMVDWYEQAILQAKSYLSHSSFSRDELVQQLSSEYGAAFTLDQAEYAVQQVYN